VTLTKPDGEILYRNDFSAANSDFSCGTVAAGMLAVTTSKDCAYGGLLVSDNWAFLRREFTVADKPVAWATAYVTARSTEPARQYVYRVSMNGTPVGVGPTRAKTPTTTMYNAYDVTDLLQRGAPNALAALAYTTSDKRFQAQLVIGYADGTRDVVATDGAWRTLPGVTAMPAAGSIGTSYFAAPVENIDARTYPLGYDTAGFDDSGWGAPVTKAALPGLTGTPTPPVERRLHAPIKVVAASGGRYLLDFGHTVVGGLRLTLNGAGGEAVEIRLGEELTSGATLTPESTVRYQLRTGNTYRDTWTLRPGRQTLEPWGYRVFRYAEVIGSPEALTAENVAAAALVYPYEADASSFSSSDAALDEVYEFSRTGVRALNFDLHLDSPTRERAPYEGDNVIHMLIQGYDDGDYANSKYSMEWLIQNKTWPMEWRLASILSVWEYWQATGDLSSARAYYSNLRAFLPMANLRPDGLVEKDPGSSSQANADLVDWPAGERDGYVFTTVNTVINAWSYRAFADMADLAAALGNDADAAQYRGIADRMRDAINEKLFDAAAGAYNDGLTTTHKAVHASIFPVAFGVAGPAQLTPAAAYVAGRGMVCSVFCANFMIDALYKAGRGGDAVRLLTDTGTRSWRHMIALGAGSAMEAWDPSLKSNTTFSHPWGASPAYLVYRGTLGIRALEPGFGRFEIRPQAGGLARARGLTPTVHGPVMAAFEVAGAGAMDVAVSVPANTSARVVLPAPDGGRTTIYVDGIERSGTPDGDSVALDVAAGCHVLSSRGPDDLPDSIVAAARTCDVTAPALDVVPADRIVEATGPDGAAVSFTAPTATDVVDGDVPVRCDPMSGATFAIGTTTVTCTATDVAGNESAGTFQVTVEDTTAPVLALPVDRRVEATGADGAAVAFVATASDLVGGDVPVECDPAPGAVFAIGTTLVTCTATDAAGNASTGTFRVTVTDTTAPTLALPADRTAEATAADGAAVAFAATATDLVDGDVPVSCDPPSGATFATGTTTVACTATDAAGNAATGTFGVTIEDTSAPTLALPADRTVEAAGPAGAAVTFAATANDLVDGHVPVACDPASGATFAIGTTTVTCSATDAANNTATGTFRVTVEHPGNTGSGGAVPSEDAGSGGTPGGATEGGGGGAAPLAAVPDAGVDRGPAATAAPRGVAGPAPAAIVHLRLTRLGGTAAVQRRRWGARRLGVRVRALGGSVHGLRLTLVRTDRRGRLLTVVGRASRPRVAAPVAVLLRLTRPLARGDYRVIADARDAEGRPVHAAVAIRLR
jgi:alpha-L-rhamnosidase